MTESEFVLCKRSAREALFACGIDPVHSSFLPDGGRARRFASVADALAYRAGLPHAESEQCAVFQLMPDGRLIPPEALEPTSAWLRHGGAERYPSSDPPHGRG